MYCAFESLPVTLIPTATGFLISLVVVSMSTYVSTRVLTDMHSYVHSFGTALLTSLVWFGTTYIVSGTLAVGGVFVALGPVLAVVAYFVVVNFRYPGGWPRAIGISVLTWVLNFAILYAATAYFGLSSFQALGVPPGI